jgi:hypothetical protein
MAIYLMRKTGLTFILVWSLFNFSAVKSQETSSLFFIPGVPQASFENPAFQNQTGKLAIGIPILSGIYANWNSNVPFNALFSEEFTYSVNRLYNAIEQNGKVQSGTKFSIFYASIKHNRSTFNVSVSERGIGNGKFDREIVSMIDKGIRSYYGSNENLGAASFQIRHYKVLSVGVARELWEDLDIGFNAKVLFGKYYLDTSEFDFVIKTDTRLRELLLIPEGSYIMSGPLLYDGKSFRSNIFTGDYFFQPRNLGFAFDAGMVLRPNNRTELAISVMDIGVIGFGHNVFDMTMARPIRFSEDNLYQSNRPNADFYVEPREALKMIADSVSFLLEVEETSQLYLSTLPLKVNISGKYNLSEMLAVGVSNHFSYYRKHPINLFSAFTYFNLKRKFELAGILSVYNLSNIFPGISTSYTGNRAQFFLSANNILGFIRPESSKHVNLCLGMNFLFDTQ